MFRRTVLVVCVAVAVCGGAVAAPPGLQPGRHAEGRELDPVARDHFLPDPPAVVNHPPAPGAPGDRDSLWAVLLGAHEAVLGAFTMELGTARTGDM